MNKNSNIRLKGHNFYLKHLKFRDLKDNYYQWFSEKTVKKFIKSSRKLKELISKDIKRQLKDKSNFFFGIFSSNGLHIGNIKFHDFNFQNKIAWLGILIGETKYRNKGIGSKSIKIATNYLFNRYNIYKFYLRVNNKNYLATSSYLKSGFKVIKRSREEFIMELDFYKNKLVLGTAQFGQPYGIINEKKKIPIYSIKKILNFSKNRISEIDTAEDYNINFKLKKKLSNYLVNTKIDSSFLLNTFDTIKKYLRNLNKVHKINILYIRNLEKDFTNKKIIQNLKKIKQLNFFRKIGISIYEYNNIKNLYKQFKYDVIQLPCNLIDNRSDKLRSFFKKNNIEIHARSIFLQGLLITKSKRILSKFDNYKEVFFELNKLEKKTSLSIYNLCILHVLSKDYVDKIVFGAKNLKQLKKIINFEVIIQNKTIKLKKLKRIDKLIDPRKW